MSGILIMKALTTNAEPTDWPALTSPLPPNQSLEQTVNALLAGMTLEEKVGQIIQAELKYVTPEDVRDYHLGSILNGGGTHPDNNPDARPADWVALADAFYHASMDTSHGGQAIPVIWGSDAVHGHNNVKGATLFPHNIGLGAARDPDLIRRIGEATAREVRATGLDWTFAPTVAVVRDLRWGRTYESYSEDPAVVRDYASAMVLGIQGQPGTEAFLDHQHVVATAKHYVGDGGTERGTDRGDTRVSEKELADIHGAGFVTALEAGVQSVMASFNSWNGSKVHGDRYLLTDVLKGRLGFDGLLVSDWNAHSLVPGCQADSCPEVIDAGLDLVMVPSDWKALYHNTLAQVREGRIAKARLDDAVRRILRVKIRAGLFEAGPPSSRALSGRNDILGSAAHRAIAREAVQKSLVLLKNNGGLLPLDPGSEILVVGDGAQDVGKQSGGWSLTWQGTDTNRDDFPKAQTLFEGIAQAVQDAGGRAIFHEDGNWSADEFSRGKPDVAIAIYGEDPYAEWHGDVSSIEYRPGNKRDLQLLKSLTEAGIPVVSVFLTGRPLWVNPEINASDAFVVAWLPGTEGGGVADVLLRDAHGQVRHDFVGQLPFSWPREVGQATYSERQGNDALFPRGYGLRYANGKTTDLAQLPEESRRFDSDQPQELWLFVSRTHRPWYLELQEDGAPGQPVKSNLASSAPGARVEVAVMDRQSQEDARRIRFKGDGPAALALRALHPQDISPFAQSGGRLEFDVHLYQPMGDSFEIVMECGTGCEAALPLAQVIPAAANTEAWQRVSIDLARFAAAEMDFTRTLGAFVIRGSQAADFALAEIKIIPRKAIAETGEDSE